MINMPKESTSYIVLSNIWLATMILSSHAHDAIFAGILSLVCFGAGVYVSRRENANP